MRFSAGCQGVLLLMLSLHCLGDSTNSSDVTQEAVVLTRNANNVTARLLETLAGIHPTCNVLLGPGSLHVVLAMTLLGSVGSSYNELVDLLGFSKEVIENRAHHEQLGAALERLRGAAHLAAAAAVGPSTPLRPVYLEFVRRIYKADVLQVDFEEHLAAKNLINDWVSSNTNGSIEQLLRSPLPRDTRLALLSAMHFRGQWQAPFFPEHTRQMTFKGIKSDINADFMLNMGHFRHEYFPEIGCQMLALPYKEAATMYVIKPIRKNGTIHSLLKDLDWWTVESMMSNLTSRNTVIRLPKMNLTSFDDLREAFETLGVKSMFTPAANFALMLEGPRETVSDELLSRFGVTGSEVEAKGAEGAGSLEERLRRLPNPGVRVDALLHQVNIVVNEFGTEASSATVGTYPKTADMFYADRPFMFYILDHSSGLVTFAALVNDPSGQPCATA